MTVRQRHLPLGRASTGRAQRGPGPARAGRLRPCTELRAFGPHSRAAYGMEASQRTLPLRFLFRMHC